MIVEIDVSNKIARLKEKVVAVCDNSDFVIRFNFDEEWEEHNTKTARFRYNGSYTDVVFNGTDCNMPVINETYSVEIGVFAGNLHTTTAAILPMKKTILSGIGTPIDPTPDVYSQIMTLLNALGLEIGDLDNLETEAKNNLVAAINEAAITGGGGGVRSVNGKTGAVELDADDVGALPNTTYIPPEYDDTFISDRLYEVESKIPSAASSENQLADKAFVNSTVGTNTAIFRGTFNSLAELQAYSGEKTNNDYAFVIVYDPVVPAEVLRYDRYKYNGSAWIYEYALNNSSFTAVQWAAIQSGISAEKVAEIGEKYVKPSNGIPETDLDAAVRALLAKANTALQEHQDISGKLDKPSATVSSVEDLDRFILWLNNGSIASIRKHYLPFQDKNISDAGGYFTTDTVEGALQEVGDKLTNVDDTPTESSDKLITSGGVASAISAAISAIDSLVGSGVIE